MRVRTAVLVILGAALLAPHARAQDLGEAFVHLRHARYAAAETLARAHLDARPDDARPGDARPGDARPGDAWFVIGQALQARGRDGAALGAFDDALAAGTTRPLAVRIAQASVHARSGALDAAEAIWRSVLEHWRTGGLEDGHELIAAGQAARALGQEDPSLRRTALRLFEEAMRRAAHDPAPRVALGELLLASYNTEEALPLFKEALELSADDPEALLGFARARHFDRAADAVEAVRSALEHAPDLVPARVFLARVLLDDDDPRAARAELDAALAVNPRSPQALSLLAALHDRDGDDDAVHALMALVLRIAPAWSDGFATLAELAADQRRYADAARFASRAIALDERDWRAHALLGLNRLRLGQADTARVSLERAFRGDPFNVWTKNTLDLLDAMDDYAVIEQGRFRLVARADQAAVLAPLLLPIAEQAYDALARRYGVEASVPVRIEVHPEHDDLSVRTLGVVGMDLLGVSFGPTVVLDAPMANPGGPFNWASVLWHELAHSFQLALSRGRAPRWIAEGMAVFDEHAAYEGWGQDVGPRFLQSLLEGRLAKASRLNEAFMRPRRPEDLGNAYLQSALLVAFIDRHHGSLALNALLEGYRDGARTPQLLPHVLGVTLDELDEAFDAYLRERFAPALEALRTSGGDGERVSVYSRLLRGATEALEAGNLERAEPALREAIALMPGHTGANGPHRALVRLLRARGARAQTVAALRALVAVDADDLDAVVELASELEALDDAPGAADALARALQIQPFDPTLHERLARHLEAEQRWAEARTARAAVVALAPADPVQARYRLALAASHAGDLETARRELLAALESAPLYEDALELLLTVRERLDASRSDQPVHGGSVR